MHTQSQSHTTFMQFNNNKNIQRNSTVCVWINLFSLFLQCVEGVLLIFYLKLKRARLDGGGANNRWLLPALLGTLFGANKSGIERGNLNDVWGKTLVADVSMAWWRFSQRLRAKDGAKATNFTTICSTALGFFCGIVPYSADSYF